MYVAGRGAMEYWPIVLVDLGNPELKHSSHDVPLASA